MKYNNSYLYSHNRVILMWLYKIGEEKIDEEFCLSY